ncbi:MAG TPA: RNA polymerase subunit sigma [Rhodospirillaceae bacterium]|nr:RNA polymerase subunit sigma [Rhodospirillaceae bacterium]|tara:strand:+ start:733 stop:1116 length:384 start_codon:yes stop_codon:yes gene_type:complete
MKQAKTVTVKQKYVEDRIHDAARTLRRLPEERVQGYFSTWPKIKRDEMEILQMKKEPMRIRPSMDDITEMEEVLFVWLRWLEVDERKLVWQRAERVRWKLICAQFGVGRTKAWEMYKCALGKIAARI